MLKILQRIVQEVNAAADFRDALNVMVARVRSALTTEACSIFLTDHRAGNYVFMATDGLNKECIGRVRLAFGQGVVGLVGQRKEPVNLDDATTHECYQHVADVKEEPFKAFLGAPIIHRRQVLGIIFVQQRQPRRYDEAEEAFLVTLSAQLAVIISHAENAGELSRLLTPHSLRRDSILAGVPCSSGVAIGQAFVIYPLTDIDAVPNRLIDDIDSEITAFRLAVEGLRQELELLGQSLAPNLPANERDLFDAYLQMLNPEGLVDEVIAEIAVGHWAQGALKRVIKRYIHQFAAMDNEYMRERAADVHDVGRRLLAHLQRSTRMVRDYPEKTILVGEEITAANLAEVPRIRLAAIVSNKGSANSHVAILSQALGIPAIMGVEGLIIADLEGKELIVDGYHGQVYITPNPTLRKEFQRVAKQQVALNRDLEYLHDLPAQTTDGHTISLYVNAGLDSDISLAFSAGAQGIGLYRTEIPFFMRDRFPSGEEQRQVYRQLLTAFAHKPVIMRTLDIGGDKPLPYFPIDEKNPFLGWRGIRISLDHPDIFLVQVRAMMCANDGLGNLKIMLPMVSDLAEVDEALRLLHTAHSEILAEQPNVPFPDIGVMIEVPSAMYQIAALAKKVSFLSVGSNDLTQYLLAVDRNNSHVAHLYNSLHPSVIRALRYIVDEARAANIPLSICGEMAGDPVSAVLLLGMGFSHFSMNATHVPRMKWITRKLSLAQAQAIYHEALTFNDAKTIRHHVEQVLITAGLDALIKPRG